MTSWKLVILEYPSLGLGIELGIRSRIPNSNRRYSTEIEFLHQSNARLPVPGRTNTDG